MFSRKPHRQCEDTADEFLGVRLDIPELLDVQTPDWLSVAAFQVQIDSFCND
jgi:hypothetical protein